MQYQIIPIGELWNDGMIAVPKRVVDSYLKFASEYQIKALLLILASNGKSDSRDIAKALGCTQEDADDFLDFWVEEGLLSRDGEVVEQKPIEKVVEDKPKQKRKAAVSVPNLTPKDIVCMCRESEELTATLRDAQEVLGKTLSHVEQELIVNMITYYGLPADVVLTILQYYKNEKAKGKAYGTSYIATMAKNWSEEGIVTLETADEKLKELESSDRLWKEIIALIGIRHKNPTIKQREMIKAWHDSFDMTMIAMACDIMKENTDKPTLKYVDTVLKNWKKKGIFTVEAAVADEKAHSDASKKDDKSKIDKTYDIDEIAKRAMFNDDYDI